MKKPINEGDLGIGDDLVLVHHVIEAISDKMRDKLLEVPEDERNLQDAIDNNKAHTAAVLASYAAINMIHDAIHDLLLTPSTKAIKDKDVRDIVRNHVPYTIQQGVLSDADKKTVERILEKKY